MREHHEDPNLVGWPRPCEVAEKAGWPSGYTVRLVRPGWYDLVPLPRSLRAEPMASSEGT
jgi:hypothetical protein